MDRGEVFKAELIGAIGTVPHTRFLHAKSSQTGPHPDPREVMGGLAALRP